MHRMHAIPLHAEQKVRSPASLKDTQDKLDAEAAPNSEHT